MSKKNQPVELILPENNDQPVLQPLSWKKLKEVNRAQRLVIRAQSKMGAAYEADNDELIDEAEAAYENAMTDLQSLIAKAVVTVPPSWISHDAPTDIQWGTAEALEYLQHDKMKLLVKIVTGQEADTDAKN